MPTLSLSAAFSCPRTLHLHISGGLRPSRPAVLAEYRPSISHPVLRRSKKMLFFSDLWLNQDERWTTRPSSWLAKHNRSETSRADSRLPNAVTGRAVLPDALFNDPGERLSASLSADRSQAGGGKAAERASPIRMSWHTTVRKSIGKSELQIRPRDRANKHRGDLRPSRHPPRHRPPESRHQP